MLKYCSYVRTEYDVCLIWDGIDRTARFCTVPIQHDRSGTDRLRTRIIEHRIDWTRHDSAPARLCKNDSVPARLCTKRLYKNDSAPARLCTNRFCKNNSAPARLCTNRFSKNNLAPARLCTVPIPIPIYKKKNYIHWCTVVTVHNRAGTESFLHNRFVHNRAGAESFLQNRFVHNRAGTESLLYDRFMHNRASAQSFLHNCFVHNRAVLDRYHPQYLPNIAKISKCITMFFKINHTKK